MNQFNQQFITAIIDRYGLEPDDYHVDSIVETWLQTYDRAWIVKAIIESLHRGRYKVKSVDSILMGWQRVGKPSYKFTPEFEREILHNLPAIADLPETPVSSISSTVATSVIDDELSLIPSLALSCEQLNPEESTPFLHHDRYLPSRKSPRSEQAQVARPEAQSDVSMPPQSLAMVDTTQSDNNQQPEELKSSLIAPLAANFQLFHTLRAIIEPNNSPSVDDLANFEVVPCIANFRFSLSSVSRERG
jgi:hypothetical protein